MGEALKAGEAISACFGIGAPRALVIRPLRNAELSVVHLVRAFEESDNPVAIPADDAFLVMLYLIDVDHSDIWPDRPPAPLKRYRKGSICLISLKEGASIAIRGRLDALAFHIPKAHFSELSAEAKEPRIGSLATCRGIDDPVIRSLGAALLAVFDMEEEVRDPILAPVGLAFNAHLAHRYGQLPGYHS